METVVDKSKWNIHEIIPGLYQCDAKTARDVNALKHYGITHVVIAASQIKPSYP